MFVNFKGYNFMFCVTWFFSVRWVDQIRKCLLGPDCSPKFLLHSGIDLGFLNWDVKT